VEEWGIGGGGRQVGGWRVGGGVGGVGRAAGTGGM